MSEQSRDTEETIELLDRKLGILKRSYDQYFLGTRPREPVMERSEVQKMVAWLSNSPIPNTALRFKFSSLCSRYQAYKRQWDETQRKIEAGTYERHRFRADRRQAPAASAPPAKGAGTAPEGDLYREYVDARMAVGQGAEGITRKKLDQKLERQREKLREKFGEDAKFQFRVAVEEGKVRLKAKRVRD